MNIQLLLAAALSTLCVYQGHDHLDLQPVKRVVHAEGLACETGIPGVVELSFTLLGNGRPTDITVLQSDPVGLYDYETIRLFKQWRYKPVIHDGKLLDHPGLLIRFEHSLENCPSMLQLDNAQQRAGTNKLQTMTQRNAAAELRR